MGISCKQCGGTSFVKNGFVRSLQRYRCKKCGCNFTATNSRGFPIATKALTVLLYRSGMFSFRKLGKLLGISAVTAYKWVHQESPDSLAEIMEEVREMEMEELCRLLYAKRASFGNERPILVSQSTVSPGLWLAVIVVGKI